MTPSADLGRSGELLRSEVPLWKAMVGCRAFGAFLRTDMGIWAWDTCSGTKSRHGLGNALNEENKETEDTEGTV